MVNVTVECAVDVEGSKANHVGHVAEHVLIDNLFPSMPFERRCGKQFKKTCIVGILMKLSVVGCTMRPRTQAGGNKHRL